MPHCFKIYSDENSSAKTGKHALIHAEIPVWVVLNASALEIAKQLLKDQPIDDVASGLCQKYSISRDTAKRDVGKIYNHLSRHDFFSKQKPERTPQLSFVYIHLTSRCNLNCPQCYIADPGRKFEDLPESLVYRMIDEAADAGAKMVVLLGGEPMLHPAIKQIIDYGASRIKLRILTNGTLINQNWAKTFREKNVQVQISFDGSTPEIHDSIRGKGVFEKAIKSANYIIDEESGDRLIFCTTIMKQNVNDLFNIISFAEKLKIPRLQFLPLLKRGRAVDRWNDIQGMDTEDYENFFQKIWDFQLNSSCRVEFTSGLSGFFLDFADDPAGKSVWCPVGNNLVIDSNGNAYPCSLLMYNDFLLGNIYENTLTEILQSDQMKNIIRILIQRRYEIEKCSDCTWRSFCQGGCMGHAFDHTNDVWQTDNFCPYRKRAFKKAMNRFLQDP